MNSVLLTGNGHGLVERVAILVKLDRLGPVVEVTCHVDFLGGVVPVAAC